MKNQKKETNIIKKIMNVKNSKVFMIIILLFGALMPLAIEKYYYSNFQFRIDRYIIFFIVFEFLFLHMFIKPKKIWDFLYKFRYLVGLSIFVCLVAFGYHGSSIGMFNYYVEPNNKILSSDPIIGENRSIRSDEWMVISPLILSQTTNQNKLNVVSQTFMGGNKRVDFYPNLPTKSLSVVTTPNYLGFLFLPREQAFSFMWFLPFFLLFFASFEFFMIILKKNKLWSLVGAIMLTFAPTVQWWESTIYIYSGMFAIVFFDKYLK